MQKYLFCSLTILISVICCDFSYGIPAFSRKYQTSCVTCHSVFPSLNAFGEAFRINGYQFPNADDEEENTKEPPVPLGADAYKKVFPNAVWPNSMPGSVPLSVRGRDGFEITTVDSATTSQFTMPALQMMVSATIGKNKTLYVGAHLFENGTAGSIDGFFLKLDNLFPNILPDHLLYVRIGQFIPELVTFASNHRGLTNVPFAFNTYDPSMGSSFVAGHTHGSGPFGIEGFQLGLEASGIVKNRLRYVLGVVNGSGPAEDINSAKDFYCRLAYKLGGLAFDGTTKEGANTDSEVSFAIGAFGYKGVGTANTIDYDFYRAGMDFNFYYKKVNLMGGYITGANGKDETGIYDLYFAQINYMPYPWLIALVRYEQANPYTLADVKQVIPHISAMVVTNVKIKVETRLNPNDMKFDNLYVGFDFAF